ncbi:TasA family protein [Nocardioides aurantiacus]|uniref:Putative ribosomally synthesized peptide with SipW-like signal peptide n=1 Tax=Nocardioides aurantiacus TaxID=86796 RepID=A0A3N2CP11_9ACTN|nr:TasA family protein [Nocardioides aurantiacus]ROR89259.1 putative ribosomally synthesized peptide with SipW-like signal peptide [Nocardioides aurantiacus]
MSVRSAFRHKRLVAAASVPVAVIASGALVWQSTYAAFSDTTTSPTNNWSTGTVKLADNDADTALFTAGNLKPGSTAARCITVTSSGTLASTVKLYGTGFTQTKALGDVINLQVQEGTGATNAGCAGFVADTAPAATIFTGTLTAFSGRTSFANGVGTWAPAGGTAPVSEAKSYRVTYTVSAGADNNYQGGTASIGLTWEAQNS